LVLLLKKVYCLRKNQNGIKCTYHLNIKNNIERNVLGNILYPPKGRHWSFGQEKISKLEEKNRPKKYDTGQDISVKIS